MTTPRLRTPAILVLLLLALTWGGGTLDSARAAAKVKFFNHDDATGVALDDDLVFKLKGRARPKHLNFDVFDIRNGLGDRPRGTFVAGTPLFDPDSGTIVVIDAGMMGDRQIEKIEKTGRIDLVPSQIRYDLGAVSKSRGARRMLMNRSKKMRRMVTFLADVPMATDLADTAYEPGATYSVSVFNRKGKLRFTSSFRTVAADDPALFRQGNASFHIVSTSPENGEEVSPAASGLYVRFSNPVDPRTVAGSFRMEVASQVGRPEIQLSTLLRQSRTGTVEVKITPFSELPPGEFIELVIGSSLKDLEGEPVEPTVITFSTEN